MLRKNQVTRPYHSGAVLRKVTTTTDSIMSVDTGDCGPCSQGTVELNDTDIPEAHLSEPFEAHNVAALRWWLLCRGIKTPTSLRKHQIIAR